MPFDKFTLKELKEFEKISPLLAGFPSRILAEGYNDFIDILYDDIDKTIYQIEENPELRQNDKEDRLTIDIKNQLRCMGYDASHDSKIGGHADLVVRKNNFLWIGEAKIFHGGYDHIWEGFLQLSTRYSTGDSNQKDGGIFIYIRHQNASLILENWKKKLSEKELPNYICVPCKKRRISFFTSHTHEGSGQNFEIRHMPVILYFQPKDKSARKTSKKKAGSD